jgi:hypothetical protein
MVFDTPGKLDKDHTAAEKARASLQRNNAREIEERIDLWLTHLGAKEGDPLCKSKPGKTPIFICPSKSPLSALRTERATSSMKLARKEMKRNSILSQGDVFGFGEKTGTNSLPNPNMLSPTLSE